MHRSLPCLLVLCGLVLLVGCSQSNSDEQVLAPPPAPPRQTSGQTYDYTHAVNKSPRLRLSRRFVVALVRFAADRPPEDPAVPFGEGPATAPAGGGANQVTVNVRSNESRLPGGGELALGMNPRDRAFLKQALMESGSFVVVERERILDIIREQYLGQSGYANPATGASAGELMGVQYLLEASVGENLDLTLKSTEAPPPSYKDGEPTLFERILKPGGMDPRQRYRALQHYAYQQLKQRHKQELNRCGVYLSMYSVRTGEVVADAFGIGGNQLTAIEDAVEDLVDKCLQIPNPPRIAAVEGDRVFLDIGENDRIKPGQKFRYLTPGREIRNSSGQVIGDTDEEGGELEVTKVEPLMSVAKVTRRLAEPVVGGIIEPLE